MPTLQCGRCNADPIGDGHLVRPIWLCKSMMWHWCHWGGTNESIWLCKSMCTLDHESQSAVVSACRARYAIAIRLAPPEVLHYVHVRLCQQRSQVKCGRAPCKNMPARNLRTHWLHGGTLSELSLGRAYSISWKPFCKPCVTQGNQPEVRGTDESPWDHMENFHELIVLIEVSGASQTISWTPSNSSRRSYAIYIYLWSSYCIYCIYCNCIHGAD